MVRLIQAWRLGSNYSTKVKFRNQLQYQNFLASTFIIFMKYHLTQEHASVLKRRSSYQQDDFDELLNAKL